MKSMYVVLVIACACCMGCRTSHSSQSQRSQSVVAGVLAEHHFAPPSVIRGADGIRWAVAARPHSEWEFELAQVEMLPDGQATVEIVSYHYGPSDWGMLGKLFTAEVQQEESVMQSAIRNRLAH